MFQQIHFGISGLLIAVLGAQLNCLDAFTPAAPSLSSRDSNFLETTITNNFDTSSASSRSSTTLFGFKRKSSEKPKNKKKRPETLKKLNKDNDMMTNHEYRLKTAGKVGTQRYADPTMIFIGNLNFTATEENLREILLPMVPSPWDISKIQIVRDWKTGDSKGYAFVRFTEPVFATLCLQQLKDKEFLGRRLKVKPANSKSESPLRKQQREEQMRLKALRRAQNPPPPPPPPKRENPEFLAYLDEDLVTEEDWLAAASEEDEDLLDEDEAGDDDEVDGWEDPNAPAPRGFG
mgnify:CR=1 FL=1